MKVWKHIHYAGRCQYDPEKLWLDRRYEFISTASESTRTTDDTLQ